MHLGDSLGTQRTGEFLLIRRKHLLLALLGLCLAAGALMLHTGRWLRSVEQRQQAELADFDQRSRDCVAAADERVAALQQQYEARVADLTRRHRALADALVALQDNNNDNDNTDDQQQQQQQQQPVKAVRGGGLAPVWRAPPAVARASPACSCSSRISADDVLRAVETASASGAAATTTLSPVYMPPLPPVQLVFLVPTVPRDSLGRIDYLSDTIGSLVEQADALRGVFQSVRVVVMNHAPNRHPLFDKVRRTHGGNALFDFVDNVERLVDPYSDTPDPDDWDNPDDRPGHAVRQQTCDLISLLTYALAHYGDRGYFLLMEDDFPLCYGAAQALHYAVNKANAYRRDWNALRTSYGANGIVLPSHYVPSLLDYMTARLATKPPDHLITQWMCGVSVKREKCESVRRNFVFRWNLFRHIGHRSSLRETGVADPPACWHPYSDVMWNVDGFQEAECPYDDLWPCAGHGVRGPDHPLQLLDLTRYPYHQHWIADAEQNDLVSVVFKSRDPQQLHSYQWSAAMPPIISTSVILFSIITIFFF